MSGQQGEFLMRSYPLRMIICEFATELYNTEIYQI